jgi:RNA polymerase primary sigma factor
MINDMGIQVYEVPPDDDALITDSAAVTTDDEDAEEVAALASSDNEFGRTTDPVRMYMREMGSVELLTRKDELDIAKRIEDGQQQIVKAISRSSVVVADFIASFESITPDLSINPPLTPDEHAIRLTDLISGFIDLSEPEDLIVAPSDEELDESADEEETVVDAADDESKSLNYDEVKKKSMH